MIERSKLLSKLNKPTDIYLYNTIDSTNNIIKTLPHTNNDVLVIANTQTNGKGRRGKSFYSPNGGLYLSYRTMRTISIPQLTMCAALAIKTTLQVLNIDAHIKWLNDIYLKDKKVAGILCEATDTHYIVGIGLNIKMKAPTNLPHITALSDHSTQHININQLAAEIINNFNNLLNQDEKSILISYKSDNLIINRNFIYNKTKYKALDILADGSLLAQASKGNKIKLDYSTANIDWV